MKYIDLINLCFFLTFFNKISGQNQPIFCPNASWEQLATPFAGAGITGTKPQDIFITTNNTIYIPNRSTNLIIVTTPYLVPIKIITVNSTDISSVFVTEDNNIYYSFTLNSKYGIGRISSNFSNDNLVFETCSACYDIFIDIDDNIYCSIASAHQVTRRSLKNELDPVQVIAGIGINGSTSYMLSSPNGIVVDTNFDLYIADCFNDRIQLFKLNQFNGITVAGNTALFPTIDLDRPTAVILDRNKYLFIVDSGNQRVVGSNQYGFRCIVGCGGQYVPAPYRLYGPQSLSVDRSGNLFVIDLVLDRIQKFTLISNSCNETITPNSNNVINSSMNFTNLAITNTSNDVSYNQPKFDALTVWNPNGITFADSNTIGMYPFGIFIDKNDTVYVPSQFINVIKIWTRNSINPTTIINTTPWMQSAIFVTSNNDIYTINTVLSCHVNKWKYYTNTNNNEIAVYIGKASYGLFIDINNTLYFSSRDGHTIMSKSLISMSYVLTIIAGTGCSGNITTTLNSPHGIFVDVNFDLYVADTGNNRIQLFRSGSRNGITVAGSGSINVTISLNIPMGVILDADKYLFIVDTGNHRIIGSGPNGFRCIVGCTELSGSASNMLNAPSSMAFDSYGNIYVVDRFNNRIQKYLRLNNTQSLSYNQPKFCANRTWDSNGITFAQNDTLGITPFGIFISINNTIYATNRERGRILIWFNDSTNPVVTLGGNLTVPRSLFVTINGDIYVDNGEVYQRVDKYIGNSNQSTSVMSVPVSCFGVFIDISETLYCSAENTHRVFKKWLGDNSTIASAVAGTGTAGSTATMLNTPSGIFVDTNFDLYVADMGNDRIQLFRLGQSNGETINTTIQLYGPVSIILDDDKYLFIVDRNNHRIIGSGSYGFRCIVGCSNSAGSTSNRLYFPRSIAFDSLGNLFVLDGFNNRIQKFAYLSNSCYDETTIASMTTQVQVQEVCSTLMITLIPSGSTPSNPVQFRRSQDFYIISLINIECNQSISLTYQWVIKIGSNITQLDQSVLTTFNELYIPARILSYGVYELELQTTIHSSFDRIISKSVFVRIAPSALTANLVQLGTSMITSGYEQDLKLNPGEYSIDQDENTFNSSEWRYKYYCRIYPSFMFPNLKGSLLTIDDSANDSSNPSCLSNRTGWSYENPQNSSITIHSKSLQFNRTYQFMVEMTNIRNSSRQGTGYVLVKVEDTHPQLIAIGCVIWTMCVPNLEYQFVNPTTQVALFSIPIGNYSRIEHIIWNVYSGEMNSSQWTLFNQTNLTNLWFFGRTTSNFTATNQLFLSNPSIQRWKFEVIYSFPTESSASALNFIINQPPQNGSCSISPLNGTTNTVFTISCPNWFDEDGIKDYSTHVWTTDRSKKLFIGSSPVSDYEVRLPSGDEQTSMLNLIVSIRDQMDCSVDYNLSSILIRSDLTDITNLIQNQTKTNPIIELLSFANQNTIGQVLSSISQQVNQISEKNINRTISNGISAASISISSLASQRQVSSSSSQTNNQSAMIDFENELNSLANTREYLIPFLTNLPILTTSNSIKLQSSTLAQLTQTTNQLTRQSLILISDKCYRLTLALYSISSKISYEDVQTIATSLIQCATNILTAVNGPLQKRTKILKVDASRGTAFPDDYDTDLESEWSKLNLIVNGNAYYQKQTAQQISNQVNSIVSKLTSILNIHLNIGQNLTINTSESFMSLETQSISSLANKQVKQVGQAQILLPSTIQTNVTDQTTVSLQSIMQPLAQFVDSKLWTNTDLSRTVSLSVFDHNGNEIPIRANDSNPIEIIIPRDPNLIVPPMALQNVTSLNSTPHQQSFHLHYVNLTNRLSASVHIEIDPLNANLSYLLIYKFDGIPQMNQTDGWTILRPSNYTYFLDNQQTRNHHSLVFGLRELNSTTERFHFTSNYKLRIYSACCVYLDRNTNQWNADGLRIGPLTNYEQTQCFSTHLTTFAGGFVVLPEPMNWEYIFANADFMQNKTIYLTIICVVVIYFILLVYARFQDRKDLSKFGITHLADNQLSDEYVYQIVVLTGHRKDSSTDSHVQFVLSGDHDQTRIRHLSDSKRKIFQNGGVDVFLMSVPKCLGPLNYLHIWHDNSGKGSAASWFLKYVIVKDLQTNEISYFICQKWFAVDKDDGRIERVLPLASSIERSQFSYLLSKQAYQNVSDGHLWFSIFSRPPANPFTRVQRCTCCFVLFFLSMFLNIMYYDLSNQAQINNSTNILRLGPLYISREQISIGIIVEIFALVPSLFLVQLFRRLRPRKSLVKKKFTFPWWFVFIGYGLSLILASLSIFFIIARGIEFGDVKSQQWLTSILTGFFSSILLTQPIKILSLAVFFACFCRKSNDDLVEFDVDIKTENNKSYSIYEPIIQSNRLTENELVYARNLRLKEIQMWSFLHELFIYLVFLCLLFVITYSNRTVNPTFQVQHLRNYFQLKQISTIDNYWNWLETRFVVNLRAQDWYNGNPPRNLSGYINDKTNRLIGWAIMRQLRVKSSLCLYQKLNSTCKDDFHSSNQETDLLKFGWKYQTDKELDSYTIVGNHGTYPGGGYVYEFRGRLSDLRGNLSKLHKLEWIDSQTRAVIIQLSLYNPNVQLFTSVTLLTEFLSTGGLESQIRIEPINVDLFITSISQLICTIFYVILIVYFMFIEIRLLFRFQQFWSLIQLGLIVCSWIGIALYICQYRECSRISHLFSETNGYVFINLQYLTYLNEFLTFMYAFCCFFGTIKLIHFFRYNARIYLFSSTLRISAKYLVGFSFLFSIMFVAFLCLFYFLFSSKFLSASSLFQTAGMLVEMILMKFDAYQLIDAAPFLGPFTFTLFIFIVVFVYLSTFLSIINSSFRQARAREKQKNTADEIYSFIWKRFRQWLGWKNNDDYDEEINRTEYLNSFDLLSKRIDELFLSLNRVTNQWKY